MTLDEILALSLLPASVRAGLPDLLRSGDVPVRLGLPYVARARQMIDRAARAGIGIVTAGDPGYPAALLPPGDRPLVLWYRGDLAALTAPAVAVVGSRAATAAGLEIAAQLGRDLAAAGITVVSGLARGVDSAAHRGALSTSTGRTAAVLGSGVDVPYPREHGALIDRIATAGIVLSEYPPGTRPEPFRFPERNRIISGLSRAVVIVEAAERSGSLITARAALDQGREVLVVPGNVLSGRNRGGHALIRDGAGIVEHADDVLDALGLGRHGQAPLGDRWSGGTKPCVTGGSGDSLLARMDPGVSYDLDALAEGSGLAPARLLTRLLDLELAGAIGRVGGGRFMRLP